MNEYARPCVGIWDMVVNVADRDPALTKVTVQA